jgi:hypothetical protein
MELTVGTRGSINLQGLTVGGVPCGVGNAAHGVIVGVTDAGLTVRLDDLFGGTEVLEIGPDRFTPHRP